jgi:hypothetical protein
MRSYASPSRFGIPQGAAIAVRALLVMLAVALWSAPGMLPVGSRSEAAESESPAEEAEADSVCTARRQNISGRREIRRVSPSVPSAVGREFQLVSCEAHASSGHRLTNGLLAPFRC